MRAHARHRTRCRRAQSGRIRCMRVQFNTHSTRIARVRSRRLIADVARDDDNRERRRTQRARTHRPVRRSCASHRLLPLMYALRARGSRDVDAVLRVECVAPRRARRTAPERRAHQRRAPCLVCAFNMYGHTFSANVPDQASALSAGVVRLRFAEIVDRGGHTIRGSTHVSASTACA
jgi:hypothetical protein